MILSTSTYTKFQQNMAYSRVLACGNVSVAIRRPIDTLLASRSRYPLIRSTVHRVQQIFHLRRVKNVFPRHTSTAAATGMPSDLEARHRFSFLIAAAPFHSPNPPPPIRPSVHLVPRIVRCATTDGSKERWKPYVVAHRVVLVSSFDFCTGRLCYRSRTLRAPRYRRNNVHKLDPNFHKRKSKGHLEESANVP
jgi:hypothetical protein